MTNQATSSTIVQHLWNYCNILRDERLKRAFEGKLVVQDPDDEPAEVLTACYNCGILSGTRGTPHLFSSTYHRGLSSAHRSLAVGAAQSAANHKGGAL
jgi:hypothetical protein